jgi:plastocyanin
MDLMKTLTDLLAPLVTPDWGALVGLIPGLLAILFVVWFVLTLRAFATAGPTRRAPARIEPLTPPELHMPGPSAAPILVAAGAAALFGGLVIGGVALLGGVVILVATLVLWGREAMRDYSHLEAVQMTLPAVVREPPAGVHMPGPSIRPFMGALGMSALFGGLIAGGLVLVISVLFLAWTLLGWLVDFRAEYAKTEEADRTGHLENIPDRRLPTRGLQLFAVLFVAAGLLQAGILPPKIGGAAAGPGGSPGASGVVAGSLPPGTLQVVAKNIEYDVKALTVTGGQPFAIQFVNQDAGIDHDVDIRDAAGKAVIQDEPHTPGGQTSVYQYTPLQPGTYTFICSVHPIGPMTGVLTVK